MPKKRYDKEYKVQALKLIKEIGMPKASKELGVPTSTMRGWIMASRQGQLDLGEGSYTPKGALRQRRINSNKKEQKISLRSKAIKPLKNFSFFRFWQTPIKLTLQSAC